MCQHEAWRFKIQLKYIMCSQRSSFFFFFFVFLGEFLKVPRLGIKSELEPSAYATATATRHPSCICHLHHSSWQCRILNPLSKVRD